MNAKPRSLCFRRLDQRPRETGFQCIVHHRTYIPHSGPSLPCDLRQSTSVLASIACWQIWMDSKPSMPSSVGKTQGPAGCLIQPKVSAGDMSPACRECEAIFDNDATQLKLRCPRLLWFACRARCSLAASLAQHDDIIRSDVRQSAVTTPCALSHSAQSRWRHFCVIQTVTTETRCDVALLSVLCFHFPATCSLRL